MFKDDIKRTIGAVLKENGYKMTNLSETYFQNKGINLALDEIQIKHKSLEV